MYEFLSTTTLHYHPHFTDEGSKAQQGHEPCSRSHSYLRIMCSVVLDSSWSHGLEPIRLLCPWNSPGKNTGAGCHFLLQGIFLTQGLNLRLFRLLLCRWIFFFFKLLSHLGSPAMLILWVNSCVDWYIFFAAHILTNINTYTKSIGSEHTATTYYTFFL